MLKLTKITKVHRSGDVETLALNEVSLQIDPGDYVAITGPSGCGKSTLLGVLGLLDVPTSGHMEFAGEAVGARSESEQSRLRQGRVGFIFQSFNLVDQLSVRDNVAMALQYSAVPKGERAKRVDDIMERLGIAHRAGHRPSQLSGGQQQRVAIARALVTRPPLLLADEPTGNLDTSHGHEVMCLLEDINREGTTLVMVTHSEDHATRARRIVRMLDGRIIGEERRSATRSSTDIAA